MKKGAPIPHSAESRAPLRFSESQRNEPYLDSDRLRFQRTEADRATITSQRELFRWVVNWLPTERLDSKLRVAPFWCQSDAPATWDRNVLCSLHSNLDNTSLVGRYGCSRH